MIGHYINLDCLYWPVNLYFWCFKLQKLVIVTEVKCLKVNAFNFLLTFMSEEKKVGVLCN
jgi:hypothetical protein